MIGTLRVDTLSSAPVVGICEQTLSMQAASLDKAPRALFQSRPEEIVCKSTRPAQT
jgi:hypothetical protein